MRAPSHSRSDQPSARPAQRRAPSSRRRPSRRLPPPAGPDPTRLGAAIHAQAWRERSGTSAIRLSSAPRLGAEQAGLGLGSPARFAHLQRHIRPPGGEQSAGQHRPGSPAGWRGEPQPLLAKARSPRRTGPDPTGRRGLESGASCWHGADPGCSGQRAPSHPTISVPIAVKSLDWCCFGLAIAAGLVTPLLQPSPDPVGGVRCRRIFRMELALLQLVRVSDHPAPFSPARPHRLRWRQSGRSCARVSGGAFGTRCRSSRCSSAQNFSRLGRRGWR